MYEVVFIFVAVFIFAIVFIFEVVKLGLDFISISFRFGSIVLVELDLFCWFD